MSEKSGTTRGDVITVFMRSNTVGGFEGLFFELLNEFSKTSHTIELVLMTYTSKGFDLPKGINLVNLNIEPIRKIFGFRSPSSFQSFRSVFRLAWYLFSRKPRAILTGTHFCNEVVILANLLSGGKTRVVISEHSNLTAEAENSKHMVGRFAKCTSKLLYRFAGSVIAVSNGVKSDLVSFLGVNPDRIKVIPNPINSNLIQQLASEPLNDPWFDASASKIIISVGRLVKEKNQALLIEAFEIVSKSIDAKLGLIGDGHMWAELEKLVSEKGLSQRVKFFGTKKNPYPHMKRADLFVSSSIYEGFGLTIAEALVLGLPIVATDCPSGPAEILANGKFGTLVESGNTQALAQAIIKTLQMKDVKVERSIKHLNTPEEAAKSYLHELRK